MKFSKTSYVLLSAITAAYSSVASVANADEIETVVVSANHFSQNLNTVTSNIHIISREEIIQKNYRSLADAVKNLPSINVKSTGGLGKSSSIFIRGASSSNNQVLILIDGIEQTDPAGVGANIANMQLDNVARIEVLKGAQSGVWGANASAGVINIITLKGGRQATVNVERGSNNTQRISSNLGAGNEQFDFSVNLATVESNGYTAIKEFEENQYDYEDDGFQQTDFSFKMGMNLDKHSRLETNIKNLTADNEYDSSLDPNAEFNNTLDIETKQLQYFYQQNQIDAKVFMQIQEIEAAYNSTFGVYETSGLTEHFGAQIGYRYGEINQATVLLEKQHYRDQLNDRAYFNTGLAVSNIHQITNSMTLNAVLRQDNYDEFKNATTGKLGIKNQFNKHFFISANIGSGYNTPNLYQLSTDNPNELKPESIKSHEITFGLFGIALTYFASVTEDKIEGVGFFPNNYFENTPESTHTKGWELSYAQSIDSINTDLKMNASWITAENNDGQLKAYIPQSNASFGFDNYSLNHLHWGMETRYTGENYSAVNKQGAQIGDYFITDAFADYQFNKHLNVYIKVNNLTNKDYVSSVADFPATAETPTFVYATGGREFYIGVRAEL